MAKVRLNWKIAEMNAVHIFFFNLMNEELYESHIHCVN